MIKWDGFTGIRSALPLHSPRQGLPWAGPCGSRWLQRSSWAENPRGSERSAALTLPLCCILSCPLPASRRQVMPGECQQRQEIDGSPSPGAAAPTMCVPPPARASSCPPTLSSRGSPCGGAHRQILLWLQPFLLPCPHCSHWTFLLPFPLRRVPGGRQGGQRHSGLAGVRHCRNPEALMMLWVFPVPEPLV